MAYTTRPETDAQRDRCITVVAPLIGATATPKLVANTLNVEFVPARDTYLAARTVMAQAVATVIKAEKDARESDEAFDKAVRLWSPTVRDEDGKAIPVQVSKLFGGVRPGKLVKLPYREEVTRTDDLSAQVALSPHLAGDAAKLEALQAAQKDLAAKTAALEAAEATRREARAKLTTAESEFDSAWGTVVRKLNKAKLGAMVPQFLVEEPKAPTEVPPKPPEETKPAEGESTPAEEEEPADEEPAEPPTC